MANTSYYFMSDEESLLGGNPKFFYGLRRTEDGELYMGKINTLSNTDSLEVNIPGDADETYPDFEYGVDFTEGRDDNHSIVWENLKYEQYRWDNRSLYYYINSEGSLVVRIGQKYTYPTGI